MNKINDYFWKNLFVQKVLYFIFLFTLFVQVHCICTLNRRHILYNVQKKVKKKSVFFVHCAFFGNPIKNWNFCYKASGRRNNVPWLIGKLRYKDDTINFLFCEKIWVFKFISIKVPWNLYKIKNAINVLSKSWSFCIWIQIARSFSKCIELILYAFKSFVYIMSLNEIL